MSPPFQLPCNPDWANSPKLTVEPASPQNIHSSSNPHPAPSTSRWGIKPKPNCGAGSPLHSSPHPPTNQPIKNAPMGQTAQNYLWSRQPPPTTQPNTPRWAKQTKANSQRHIAFITSHYCTHMHRCCRIHAESRKSNIVSTEHSYKLLELCPFEYFAQKKMV